MIKIVNVEVDTCSDCPYCHYDGYYDRSRDSGHDCSLGDFRIIDDYEWDNTNNPKRLSLTESGIPIPKICPLPDKNYTEAKV